MSRNAVYKISKGLTQKCVSPADTSSRDYTENGYFCLWTDARVRFMRDAYEEVQFQEVLAEHVAKHISLQDTVCDCGCGLGYLALSLCRYADRVSAADVQELPLAALSEAAESRGITNLDILKEDVFRCFPAAGDARVFDDLIVSFFGQIPEILELGRISARKKVILFRKCWKHHRLSYDEIPLSRLRFYMDCEKLDELGIPYESEIFDLDMGQPFRSLEDAVEYFCTYSRDDDTSMLTEEFVRQKLIERDSEEFPLYYPMPGKVGMLVIHSESLRSMERALL